MTRGAFVSPKRSLGQNFLVDPNICRRIVRTLGAPPGGPILEIGPGRGALTKILIEEHSLVMALEKDRDLVSWLHQEFPTLGLIHGDGLTFCWEKSVALPGLFIVGNLPYNIASPMIWEMVSRCQHWSAMVFMVQKEVAQRLTASSGSGAYGALSAWVGNFVIPCYEFSVPAHVFRPRPKIESAVVRFVPHPDPAWAVASELSWVLKVLFQQRRKQLGSILKAHWSFALEAWCARWYVDRRVRPEDLSPEVLRDLARVIGPNSQALK
ncbi:MAG: 16S rRNA (adenine(1518)-N(6)/adenine(1519)-N(6))-dimethyltransferase RsmA [Desulfomicrobium sp.]|nr:16S rRNA (adenine(1518)-N(6)/adenine(1519)-N(6))-dimethyltransferase RsmA [Desulfomicrobium sp.]